MLIGLDFMLRHNATINLGGAYLEMGKEIVPIITGNNKSTETVKVAKVTVKKRTVVPAFSVLRIACSISQPLSEYIVEPTVQSTLVPRSLHAENTDPVISFVNCSDQQVTLHKNQTVGQAIEIDSIMEENESGTESESESTPSPIHVQSVSKTELHADNSELPEHLHDLFERSKQNLKSEEILALKSLLQEFAGLFSKDEFDIGTITAIEHKIDTGNATPIKQRMRRTPVCFAQEEEKHLNKMLKAGVIEPSSSEWASAPVLIRKRDGTLRWCIDYRALNAVTKKDLFPMPLVEQCIDALEGNVWFTKLDANSAYWQVKVNDADKCKTAFITKYGLFQCTKMSFGLCNAPATYTRIMNLILHGLHWKTVLAFLDDILVLGKTFEEHILNITEVLHRFQKYGIKLKPKKCELFQEKVEFLGRVISTQGMEVGESYIDTMKNWPVPTSTRDVERFCGFANYHRNFIKDFARITVPLYAVTGKQKFRWGEEQQLAFEEIKQALTSAPVLTLPNAQDTFILDTDASDYAVGAALSQVQKGQERAIAFASFSLEPEQRRYCTTRKELLAVVRFTRHFRHYLLGRPFLVRTDHSSLQWLMNFKNPSGQIARWLEELSQYDMQISHRVGAKHLNADTMSRLPEPNECPNYRPGVTLSDLPCGGCKYCTRAQGNWGQFKEDVDYAVPLGRLFKSFKSTSVQCDANPVHLDRVDNSNNKRDEQTVSVKSVNLPLYCGYSADEIKNAQSADTDISIIYDWLDTGKTPTEGELFLSSPAAKSYWLDRQLFSIDKSGLLWKSKKDGSDKLLLVIPDSLKPDILSLCHDTQDSGHQGIERTLLRVKDKYYWYGRKPEIQNYIAKCADCNKNKKPSKHARCNLTKYHAGFPMERVHMDFLGPLPVTKNHNSYILVMVDQFTKWVECIALPSQTAEITAQAAVNQFFSRFGYPFQIFTDQGSNFESNLFKNLCERLDIAKTRTTPFRPSANGQAERVNRVLLDSIRCFVSKTPTNWDECLPRITGALRSAVNRSTGYTANMLMLGREVNQPVDLVFPHPSQNHQPDCDQYVAELSENITLAHQIARKTLQTTQAIMKRNYDVKTLVHTYNEGDVIYVLDTASVKGKCRKLSPTWKGPGIIIEKLTDYTYRVRLRGKTTTVNHDRIKLCNDRHVPEWIGKYKKGMACSVTTGIYCLCRGPDTGSFMIQCNECREWYHGTCVKVTAEQAKSIDIYECPPCTGKS